jgi:ferritin-like metal-binding protein YciE
MRALLEAQMSGRLHDVHAMERDLHRQLDEMIEKTDDPQLRSKLEQHVTETRHHQQRLIERLQAHGESANESIAETDGASTPKDDLTVAATATATVNDEKGHMRARDSLIATRVKIAFYRQLEITATRIGDEQTAQVARWNREQDEGLMQTIAAALRARTVPT